MSQAVESTGTQGPKVTCLLMEVETARRRKKVEAPCTGGRKERKVAGQEEEEERLRKQLTENLGKLIPRDRLGAVSSHFFLYNWALLNLNSKVLII